MLYIIYPAEELLDIYDCPARHRRDSLLTLATVAVATTTDFTTSSSLFAKARRTWDQIITTVDKREVNINKVSR